MNKIKQALLLLFALVLFSACSANRMQRLYVEEENSNESVQQEVIYVETPVVIVEPVNIYIPAPAVNNQGKPAEPKTKVRSNTEKQAEENNQRESTNNNKVRNSTGQRNSNSRGK